MRYVRQRVYLLRHGETAWSLSGQHTGNTDIALTDNGRAVAKRLAPVLRKERFELVLTSPLQRARQTCELAGLGAHVTADSDLLGWNYGDYEGATRDLASAGLRCREGRPGRARTER